MKNLFAIVLVAGSFGIFYVIMAPTYEVIKTSLAEKAGYNKALNNSAAVTERQAVLGSKYNEMAPADVARLEKFLPDGIDNIRLIIEVDNIAKQFNMTLANPTLSFVDKSQDATSIETVVTDSSGLSSLYGTAVLTFGVKGTYPVYIEFIKNLEKSLRLMDITAVSLNSNSGSTDTADVYDFKTTINIYWLKK